MTRKIHDVKEELKDHLYKFVKKFDLDLLVPENALTIPLNLPLGHRAGGADFRNRHPDHCASP